MKYLTKVDIFFRLGIILIASTAILAGVVKLYNLLDLEWYKKLIETLPLYGLCGIPIMLIGGFRVTKDKPELRRLIIISTILLSFSLLMIIFIISTI